MNETRPLIYCCVEHLTVFILTHQSDFMLLFNNEQLFSLDVEVCTVQDRFQRNQTDYLRPHHWQVQILSR